MVSDNSFGCDSVVADDDDIIDEGVLE